MVQSQLKLFEIAPNRMPWNMKTERAVLNMQAFSGEFHSGRATSGASGCFDPKDTNLEVTPASGARAVTAVSNLGHESVALRLQKLGQISEGPKCRRKPLFRRLLCRV